MLLKNKISIINDIKKKYAVECQFNIVIVCNRRREYTWITS
ncbi:hypothetical protein [Nanhaiella sioensis]